jgi:hypothetical protein
MAALAFFSVVGDIVGVHTPWSIRTFFDIVMPCFWTALLSSPSMKQWISLKDSKCDFRCSIADLLFITTVSAFLLALWSMFDSWRSI